jgi:assimilatory nitrate reductase catalytic subunit
LARVGDLVAPQTDAFSGQPEAKATPVAVAPVTFAYYGFVLAREAVGWPDDTWWARFPVPGATGYLFASDVKPAAWHEFAPGLFPDAVLTEYFDRRRDIYRAAAFADGRVEGALFVAPADLAPQWGDLRNMIGGAPIAGSEPMICACFGVGLAAIRDALVSRQAASVEALGLALRAGTKCGTCLPEIRSIVREEVQDHEQYGHERANAV